MSEKNWWDGVDFPRVAAGTFNHTWAKGALAQHAIRDSMDSLHRSEASGISKLSPDHFVACLTDLGGRVVDQALEGPTNSYRSIVVVWPEAIAEIFIDTDDLEIDFYYGSTDRKLFKSLHALGKLNISEKVSAGKVFVVTMTQQGPALQNIGMAGSPLIKENYIPEVVEDFEHVVEDLKSDNPCGRIIMFDGAPGTGKTFIVRGLLHDVPKAMFVMVPPALVQEMSGPSMVGALVRYSQSGIPIVLVVEDADQCLVSRGSDNMGSIATLLNLSDGILGATLNLRIVCTTNAGSLTKNSDAIDEAIMRPGRLCRRIEVPKLGKNQAKEVYQRLTKNTEMVFDEPMMLAEIYRLARDAGWKPAKSTGRVGFKANKYNGPGPFDPDY